MKNPDENSTILAGPAYSWILYDVFDMKNTPLDYSMILFYPLDSEKITVIADPHFILDLNRGEELEKVYNYTHSVKYFEGKISSFDLEVLPLHQYENE